MLRGGGLGAKVGGLYGGGRGEGGDHGQSRPRWARRLPRAGPQKADRVTLQMGFRSGYRIKTSSL